MKKILFTSLFLLIGMLSFSQDTLYCYDADATTTRGKTIQRMNCNCIILMKMYKDSLIIHSVEKQLFTFLYHQVINESETLKTTFYQAKQRKEGKKEVYRESIVKVRTFKQEGRVDIIVEYSDLVFNYYTTTSLDSAKQKVKNLPYVREAKN